MSRIDELIAEHCKDGVKFKRLGDIARIKNGKDHKSLDEGDIPVYGTGGIMRYVDTYAYDKPSVLIPRKGSLGNLFYVDVPFWNVDTIFYTEVDESRVLPKFLYYFLTTVGLGEMNQAGGVPSQTQSVLNELKIPVPPLEVQREIVKVLDTFTKLEAELEAELEARRRQYQYYRDALLTFDEHEMSASKQLYRWMTLGEIATIGTGSRRVSVLCALPGTPND
jgi:type I restriction enzyme S subunit